MNKEASHIICKFVSYQPSEGSDTIRYLYKARELANCYDQLIQLDSADQERIANYMRGILRSSPFYQEMHLDEI